tara:strand:- start:980 stop:1282 length:303 start_codon:yes stop_codon:yes gene_type:complete
MKKDKMIALCMAFARLNEVVKVVLGEVAVLRQGKVDFDMDNHHKLRAECFAHVTALLMSEVFEGEDAQLVMELIREVEESNDEDMMNKVRDFVQTMNNPN